MHGEDGGDGDKTPEGDRTSTDDDGGAADGPVLDIWGNEVGTGSNDLRAGGLMVMAEV